MKKRFLSLLAIGFLCCYSTIGFAQTGEQTGSGGDVLMPTEYGGWLIGPVGGLNLVTYSTDKFPLLNSEPTCFEAQNGAGIAPFFGVSAEFPLNAEVMQNFIIVELLYDSKSAKFTGINNSRDGVPTKLNGVEQLGSVTTEANANLAYLLFNVGYKYNFVQSPTPVGPGIQLTLNAGIRMSSTIKKTVTLDAAVVGSQTLTSTEDVVDPAAIRFGLRGQFTYDLPLTESWVATPFGGYDLPFTKVESVKNWSASSAYVGIAVRALIGR